MKKFPFIMIVIAALACNLPGQPLTPTPSITATAPAATLAAARTPQAGAQTLAFAPIPKSEPASTPNDMLEAIDLIHNVGARGAFIGWSWKMLEPTAGNFAAKEVSNGLKGFEARNFEMMITIQVINTLAKETPPDLASVAFDSPQMKQRLHALIDAALPHIGKNVKYISIGNEVDSYLMNHPSEWAAYKNFYDDAAAYVHSVAPTLKVGVATTFGGANGAAASQVASLNQSSDVFILTYYPLDDQFIANNPAAPLTDFPQMIALANGKPLILKEVGYPSSATLKSSEEEQAEFVANVFKAWQSAGARIPYLAFFALHDFGKKTCDDLTRYYGASDRAVNFKAYLCTLGLRRADGTAKAAWKNLEDGIKSLPK